MAFIVYDDGAYEAAIDRKIKENARKGRGVRWLAEVADRKELVEKMYTTNGNTFIEKMINAYHQWGSLSIGQEAAVRKIFDKNAERKAEFAAKDANSKHIGSVGIRQNFELTVRNVINYETDYGMTYIHIMNDNEGNVIVHKGTCQGVTKGDKVKGKATIKEHGIREGVNQTIISRPKFEKVGV